MPRRPLLSRLALVAAACGLALLCAEGLVRVLRPQSVLLVSPGLYAPDPPYRYRLAPDFRGTITDRVEFTTTVAMNHDGLRGPELGPKRPGVLRILALGDSFTFGVGVAAEQAWPAVAAADLARGGAGAEALNAGAPGYGAPDELGWLEAHGLGLDPDLVLLGVFVGNDLQDATPGLQDVQVVDGALVVDAAAARSLAGRVKRWLYYHSHLYVLAKAGIGSGRRLLGLPEPWAVREQREEMRLYSDTPTPASTAGAAATGAAYARLAELGRERGFRVGALVIPSLQQVDPRVWRATLARLHLDPAHLDPARPTRIFLDLLARAGIPALDLAPIYAREIAAGARLYYSIDGHLTPAGQALTGHAAARFVRERGLDGRSTPRLN